MNDHVVFSSPISDAKIVKESEPVFVSEDNKVLDNLLQKYRQTEPAASMTSMIGFLNDVVSVKNGTKKRPSFIPGHTQKIKTMIDGKKSAIYITINSVLENEKYWPFEIFFNCSDTRLAGWLSALGKTISALMKFMKDMHMDSNFIAKNLENIQGEGYFDSSTGSFIPSIQAHIGMSIRINNERNSIILREAKLKNSLAILPVQQEKSYNQFYDICPDCNKKTLLVSGGCKNCENCDYTGGCG